MTNHAFASALRPVATGSPATRAGRALGIAVLSVALSGFMTTRADAQLLDDRLAIHGFLSQAWARAWDNPIAGIPTGGSTFDYRAVAIQIGYGLSDADRVVIQLNHRRSGQSALEGTENRVRLNWAFYERRFGAGTVRIGKVPFSAGLFNELRNVGTVLPFYRAPLHFYGDGSETMDGVILSYRFWSRNAWSLVAEASAGQFDMLLALNDSTGGQFVVENEVRELIAANVWLEAPWAETRIGVGGSNYEETSFTGAEQPRTNWWTISAESKPGPVTIRAEYMQAKTPEYTFRAKYAQAGLRILPSVNLNAQTEFSHMLIETPFGEIDLELAHDHALGVAWSLAPNVVLKLEGHRFKGFGVDRFVAFGETLPEARYAIASIAVGF